MAASWGKSNFPGVVSQTSRGNAPINSSSTLLIRANATLPGYSLSQMMTVDSPDKLVYAWATLPTNGGQAKGVVEHKFRKFCSRRKIMIVLSSSTVCRTPFSVRSAMVTEKNRMNSCILRVKKDEGRESSEVSENA